MIDLTLAITAHDETHVAVPTIRSAVAALHFAEERGVTTELLLGFDDSSEACRDLILWEIHQAGLEPEEQNFAFRDQGATRNALVQSARGRFLAFLDADDLFTENWLAAGVAQLEAALAEGRKAIAHPELLWHFDKAEKILMTCGSDDPFFSLHVLAVRNYYDALCIAPVEAWRDIPFAARDLGRGFALEDYQWVVETVFAGWEHIVVPDTVIFKRKRAVSQSQSSRQANAMIRRQDQLRIDKIRKGLSPRHG